MSDITRSIHLSLRCPESKSKCSTVVYSEFLITPDSLAELFSLLDSVIISTFKTKQSEWNYKTLCFGKISVAENRDVLNYLRSECW